MNKIRKLLVALTIVLLGITLLGCNNEKSDKFLVVSTTTMLNDAVKQLAGDNVEAVSLIKAGVDPHTYTLVSQDVKKLQKADLVIVSGLHLEAQMGETLKTLGDKVLDIGVTLEEKHNNNDGVVLLGWEDQLHDPHFWFNVDY
ncbi:MAG: metal ABC transporter substrate-binding protein [Acholeplasmataceae bacterium]